MNIENIKRLQGIVELLLENESRINEAKPSRYWYPLSQATFGSDEIIEALDSMCSFRTSMAEKTLQFERQFAAKEGCADSIMVNSGSSADLLLCHLLTNPMDPILEKGAEILIPVVTWPTQIWSAMMAGLTVRLVDVDPETLNIDIADLEAQITPNTKAIFLVHIMGNPCNMDAITSLAKKYGLIIIEDCCEAYGSTWNGQKVGTFGIGGTYSFFFSHHITCMEGGMIVVNKVNHAEQLRLMRAHGWARNADSKKYITDEYADLDPRYAFLNWGLNLRPTEVQASFGIQQLLKADMFEKRRQEISEKFNNYIKSTTWLKTPLVCKEASPSWLALPMSVDPKSAYTKEEITRYLEDSGVETRPLVAGNLAKHPVSKLFPEIFMARKFPGADLVHKNSFYIGLSPMSTDMDIEKVIELFKEFEKRYH
jgi:CDP-6-deoxy-D-xylo-4-hexulose-3-dehydrase